MTVKLRGFGSLKKKDPERMKEIARQGGQASAAAGKGHRWNEESARKAGRKGGLARAKNRRKAEGLKEGSTDK